MYTKIKYNHVSWGFVGMAEVFYILAHSIPKIAPIDVARILKLAPGMG